MYACPNIMIRGLIRLLHTLFCSLTLLVLRKQEKNVKELPISKVTRSFHSGEENIHWWCGLRMLLFISVIFFIHTLGGRLLKWSRSSLYPVRLPMKLNEIIHFLSILEMMGSSSGGKGSLILRISGGNIGDARTMQTAAFGAHIQLWN